jgi:DNA polymerase-3 subunit delta'
MHLVGNSEAKKTLDRFVREEIPPVLLFEGTAGVGKRLFAKAMIQDVLGNDPRVERDNHPDVFFVDHQVDKIRQLLQDVDTYPFESPYRFYLIDNVDEMLPVHMNALLKTFEEAPLFNRFILFATYRDRILPTILSRSLHIHFSPISLEEIQNHFTGIPPAAASKIAKLSSGSLGKAKLLIEEGFLDYYPLVLEALKYHLMQDYLNFYETLEQIQQLKEGRTTPELLTILQHFLIDLYKVEKGLSSPLFFPEEKENLLRCKGLLQTPFPHLLSIFHKAKEGLLRHTRFTKCLEYVLLSLF